ncbi:hypothetical protein [Pontibacillus marinus]|uniref:DUF4025 domain-containing protein n=1 Tax=Pontibacillus marinus BH030004 = DSM 16465 TaxID=1385511 RepID=A0A0A5G6F8_9BACI|nr:hypothetical protein [Pontibacillus marinus]KGX87614.1 hypothetical protein N783_09360 [Pontibacillus marinus BH030004 = DSM 16465]
MSKKRKNNEETHNEMSEAFNANIEINKAFNNQDGDDGQTEGESLAHHYLYNNTPAIDVSAKGKRESDMEKELKNHD